MAWLLTSASLTSCSTSRAFRLRIAAVTQYTRQFDWGHAPTAGFGYTLIPGDAFNFTAIHFLQLSETSAIFFLAPLLVALFAGVVTRLVWLFKNGRTDDSTRRPRRDGMF